MADPRLPAPRHEDAEVRLELTNAEGRQVWALYSRPPQQAGPAETPLSVFLHELPPLAWKWRRHVGLAMAATFALGVIYLIFATTIYGVTALVLVEHRDAGVNEYGIVRDNTSFLATQAEVLHSPPVLREALVRSGIGFPPPDPGILDTIISWIPFISQDPVDPEKLAVAKALEATVATPVLGTQVIALNYRIDDAEAGLRFVGSLVDSYTDYVHELDQSGQAEALQVLASEEQARREELRTLELQYEALRATGGSLGDDEQNALSVQAARLEEHARQLVEAQSERIRLENELRAARDYGSEQSEASSEALRTAEQKLTELRQNYSDRHPEVKAVLAQIESLRAPTPQTGASQAQDLERRLRAARDTERNLSSLYESEFRKSKQVDVQRMREQRLAEDVNNAREAHQSALRLLNDKKITVQALAKDGTGVVVRMLQAPTLLDYALWPRPIPVLFCCLVIGALAGLGLAVVAERGQEPEPEVYAAGAALAMREGVRAG
jgi:uncharacterized protein involved in exopolysaccharide biosynthesis